MDFWFSVVVPRYYHFLVDNIRWVMIVLAVLGGVLAGAMDDVAEDIGERMIQWAVCFFLFPFVAVIISLVVVFFLPLLLFMLVVLGLPASVGYFGFKIYRHVSAFGWRKK